MGSTCCKSPYSPNLPNLGEFFTNCPIQLCLDKTVTKEEVCSRVRKYSISDISGPLPLGTVIAPPKRPPRKKKRKISRCHSTGYLDTMKSELNLVRSKSAVDLTLDGYADASKAQDSPCVHVLPLIVTIGAAKQEDTLTTHAKPAPQQLQQVISQNKRTFLATLLEENNNLRNNVKDSSRRSSISESLREFESSLYDMLQENAEDERSERSLHLNEVIVR